MADSFCFGLFAGKESLQKRIDITAGFFYNKKIRYKLRYGL